MTQKVPSFREWSAAKSGVAPDLVSMDLTKSVGEFYGDGDLLFTVSLAEMQKEVGKETVERVVGDDVGGTTDDGGKERLLATRSVPLEDADLDDRYEKEQAVEAATNLANSWLKKRGWKGVEVEVETFYHR